MKKFNELKVGDKISRLDLRNGKKILLTIISISEDYIIFNDDWIDKCDGEKTCVNYTLRNYFYKTIN